MVFHDFPNHDFVFHTADQGRLTRFSIRLLTLGVLIGISVQIMRWSCTMGYH